MDSDEEAAPKKPSLFDSFDEVNYEVSVKVRWLGDLEKFTLKKFEPFRNMLELLAQRENASLSQVVLMKDDDIIKPDDTPDSIGYRITNILSKCFYISWS